jgi:hypothetical protein
MFCPNCGLEERELNQFCRACGADLRVVRVALETPDNITQSAVSAREEIGRAIAAKIRDTQKVSELKKVANEVLPEIEKFLESPEQKRLRRVRSGTVVASIGLGAAIAFSIAAVLMGDAGVFFVAGLGLVTLFIGLSLILNALLFTVPKKSVLNKSPDATSQRELDGDAQTNEFVLPESNDVFSSVTEHTTHQLNEKQTVPRN